MTLIVANIGVAVTAFLLGALTQDSKGITKQEKRQGAVIGLMILVIVVVSGIAH